MASSRVHVHSAHLRGQDHLKKQVAAVSTAKESVPSARTPRRPYARPVPPRREGACEPESCFLSGRPYGGDARVRYTASTSSTLARIRQSTPWRRRKRSSAARRARSGSRARRTSTEAIGTRTPITSFAKVTRKRAG